MVDDEPLVLRSLERVLSRAGWTVSAHTSAASGLAYLDDHSVDAAIIDYDLGDHDGLSVLRKLRDTAPTSVRVLMTGHDDLPLVVAAINRGEAFKVLRKPFQQAELLTLLEEALSSVDAMARASLTRKVAELKDERTQLLGALTPTQLGFAVQPILHAETSTLFAQEALLRPRHPAFPGPIELLVAVERHGRVQAFGEAVLAAIATWLPACPRPVFVNLHPQQLGDPAHLERSLRPLHDQAHRIVLEITERSSLQELGDWETSVHMLRDHGYSIAVDDLGAGYSTLAMLADLQPQYIKLDRSLITGLHLSSRRQRLVQLLATFGQTTGAKVIAEGIEEPEELETVVACGIPLVQGYLLGQPQPVSELYGDRAPNGPVAPTLEGSVA